MFLLGIYDRFNRFMHGRFYFDVQVINKVFYNLHTDFYSREFILHAKPSNGQMTLD